MDVEFSPEPSPEERAVLLQALDDLDERENDGPAWWTAGTREAVEEDPES